MSRAAHMDLGHSRGLPRGIDGTRLDLAREFKAQPFGRHSPDLQALLNYMRAAPMPGKFFLWMVEPHAKWVLARFADTSPLKPMKLDDHVFEDIEEAEWFVFKERWKSLFGVSLEIQ